jgi:hypothetical protein
MLLPFRLLLARGCPLQLVRRSAPSQAALHGPGVDVVAVVARGKRLAPGCPHVQHDPVVAQVTFVTEKPSARSMMLHSVPREPSWALSVEHRASFAGKPLFEACF